jgi:hypothetical protein
MKSKALFAAVGVLAMFSVAGCGDRAAENAAPGGEGVAESAGRSVDQAGQEVRQETREAGQEASQAAQNAGQAVENTAENAGEAVGNVAQGAAKETQDAAQVLVLTPKVKNALIADEKINASNLNVDTSGEANTVTITGTVPSAAAKQRVTQVAKQALGDAASKMKIMNNVTVAQ